MCATELMINEREVEYSQSENQIQSWDVPKIDQRSGQVWNLLVCGSTVVVSGRSVSSLGYEIWGVQLGACVWMVASKRGTTTRWDVAFIGRSWSMGRWHGKNSEARPKMGGRSGQEWLCVSKAHAIIDVRRDDSQRCEKVNMNRTFSSHDIKDH